MIPVVLIVDDEPDVREILKDILEQKNILVLEADNGRKAFDIIISRKIDCVLSDIRMPGGGGVELCEKIKLLSGSKPQVFLMSGYSDFNLEQQQNLEIVKILCKPFEPQFAADEIIKSLNLT